MVKQAEEFEIPFIEDILLDAVYWMEKNGLQNLWNESNVKWSNLRNSYKITDFYISYQNGEPAACMALTDYDPIHWPDIPKGESLYLHKLAVKREYAGKGCSRELIDFAKALSYKNAISSIRLNCNGQRTKLREVYEKEGFICEEEKTLSDKYVIALYIHRTDNSNLLT